MTRCAASGSRRSAETVCAPSIGESAEDHVADDDQRDRRLGLGMSLFVVAMLMVMMKEKDEALEEKEQENSDERVEKDSRDVGVIPLCCLGE